MDNEASLGLIDIAMGGVDMDEWMNGWIDTTAVLVFFLGLASWDCLAPTEK